MHKKGHIGINALLYSPIAFTLSYYGYTKYAIIGGILIWFFSGIPDIDQKIPKVKHRGPVTHSVFSAIGASIITTAIISTTTTNQETLIFTAGITIFIIIGHLLGDIITPSGIEPIAPYKEYNISLDICKAKNPIANWGFFIGGFIILLLSLAYGTGILTHTLIP